MSAVLPAVTICERALRAIGAFPITESGADGEQLREAMIWLDLIMGQIAGETELFFLVPETLSFTLQNGLSSYPLDAAFGANLPVDQIQFPIEAYFLTPSGNSVVGFGSSIPGGVTVGLSAADLSTAANIPPGATVAAINGTAKQITLSGPSTVAAGDILQFGSTQLTSTGTVGGNGFVAGTAQCRRRVLPLVKRDVFMARDNPDETGHPRMAYIDRLPSPTLQLWPNITATDSGLYLFELDVQTYAANVAPAGVTGTQPQAGVLTNFRQAWQRWLVCQLSHDLGAGPIFKLPESSLTRFGAMASQAKEALLAFENREHETTPPICASNDSDDFDPDYRAHIPRYR